MLLKQLAITEAENDILFDLVHHELRFAGVYGTNPDIIPLTRALLDLYDQLDKFNPSQQLQSKENEGQRATKEKAQGKKANQNPVNKKIRRPRQRDLQEGE